MIQRPKTIFYTLLLVSLSTSVWSQWEDSASQVIVDEVRQTMLAPHVDVPGTVISRFDSRLASELAAKLVWIADVGTKVSKGDTLARLENITFRLQEAEARSQVTREQARVTFLSSEVARLQKLAAQNNAAKSRLDQTISNLAVAESDEAIAKARLGLAQVAMAITEIKAPFDGVVTEKLRNLGERLNVADEVIRLVNPNSIEVVARAPLSTVNFVQEKQQLSLHNDYRTGIGSVRTIVPFGDPQSHMFEVRLDVDPSIWTVGESVRLAMPTAQAEEVLAVPRDALILRREGVFVFRIKDDTAEQIRVVTGLGDGTLIQVIGDLNPGDKIVIRGGERLAPGAPVAIAKDGAGGSETNAKP